MKIHILGIGGTFMSALAILARLKGYDVSGSDENVYSPIKDLLEDQNIAWSSYSEGLTLIQSADLILVGNGMKRGMPIIEKMLNENMSFMSGPAWLYQEILSHKKVIAVAGTHGKTTTTSMLIHIFKHAGLNPSFLLGGIDTNVGCNANLSDGEWFIIEADEYDSAFFDKRPKFIHYFPLIAILNNLEFDHADIYQNIGEIEKQFHFFLKTIKGNGWVISNQESASIRTVLNEGVFCHHESTSSQNVSADWSVELDHPSGKDFTVFYKQLKQGVLNWSLIGIHNVENALSAIAASHAAGINAHCAINALTSFKPVKRRLETIYEKNGITVIDDFAHHPTAIQQTLMGLQNSKRYQRILLAVEFGSYTMAKGVHMPVINRSLQAANFVYILKPKTFEIKALTVKHQILESVADIASQLASKAQAGDVIVVMSNKDFDGLKPLLLSKLG